MICNRVGTSYSVVFVSRQRMSALGAGACNNVNMTD